MQIQFYSTLDGINVINKELEKGVLIPFNFKKEVDISEPLLVLNNLKDIDFRDYNYCYIDDLERYYHIESVIKLNYNLTQISLKCDVLETYKNDILSSVSRFNRGLLEGDYGEITIPKTNEQNITKYTSDVSILDNDPSYILTSLGK